jgi:hypothetical protein
MSENVYCLLVKMYMKEVCLTEIVQVYERDIFAFFSGGPDTIGDFCTSTFEAVDSAGSIARTCTLKL